MIIPKKLSYSVTIFTALFCAPFYSSAQEKPSPTKELIGLYLLNKKLDQNDFDQFLNHNQITANDIVVLLNERKYSLEKEIGALKQSQYPLLSWLGGIAGSIIGFMGYRGFKTEEEKIVQSLKDMYHRSLLDDNRKIEYNLSKGYISQEEYDIEVKERYKLLGPKPTLYEPPFLGAYQLLMAGGLIMVPFAAYKAYNYYAYERDRKKEIEIIDNIIEQIDALK